MRIVEATREDAAALASLHAASYPLRQATTAEFEQEFGLEERFRPRYWIAYVEDEPVGLSSLEKDIGSYHADKWSQIVGVLSGYRGNGIGKALWEQSISAITGNPLSVMTSGIQDDDSVSISFARRRGFEHIKTDFESELHLSGFDFPVTEVPGFVFIPLSHRDTPEMRVALHQLFEEVRKDIPRAAPPTPLEFDFYCGEVLDHPDTLKDGFFLVLQGDDVVGFSSAYKAADGLKIAQGLTAVRKDMRGQGLAQALKVRVARWALENGYRSILTDNDSRNAAMLAINGKLGFQRLKGTLTMLWRP